MCIICVLTASQLRVFQCIRTHKKFVTEKQIQENSTYRMFQSSDKQDHQKLRIHFQPENNK
jgi:hypothetical protein